MKGTPASLWLSMANRAANQAIGFWSGIMSATAKRNATAMTKAMMKPPAKSGAKPVGKSKRTTGTRPGSKSR